MENYRTFDLAHLRALGFVDLFDTPAGKEAIAVIARRMADDIEAEVAASLLK